MWTQSCFKSGFWNTFWNAEKKSVLDRDPPRKPESRTCECKALSEHDSCMCVLKMRPEAMHKSMGQSARTDCAIGARYYLAVRRSWSWLGRRLQCMWTHIHVQYVVQITIPIMFWIAIWNVFQNVILAQMWTQPMKTYHAWGCSRNHAICGWGLCWWWSGWGLRGRSWGGGGPLELGPDQELNQGSVGSSGMEQTWRHEKKLE